MGNTQIQLGNQTILVEKELGSGGFGKLYLAHPQDNPLMNYALKTQSFFDQNRLDCIKKEIAIQKRCSQNEFICQLYLSAAFSNPRKEVLMLMEYCPTSLVQILEKSYPNGLAESVVLGIFYQIAHAIAFLHSQNPPIVHRDIKVENILFSSNRKFKLIDFGSATFENDLIRKQGDCGYVEEEVNKMTTPEYRAPELISVFEYLPIGCKIDVWALGCLIYKCLKLTTPFEDSPMKIQAAKYEMPNCTPFFQSLFQMIFIRDPTQRADIFQVLGAITDATKLPNPYINNRKPFYIHQPLNVIQKQPDVQLKQTQQDIKPPQQVSSGVRVSGTKTTRTEQSTQPVTIKKLEKGLNENTIKLGNDLAKKLPRSPKAACGNSKIEKVDKTDSFGTFNFDEPQKIVIPKQQNQTTQSFEFCEKCEFRNGEPKKKNSSKRDEFSFDSQPQPTLKVSGKRTVQSNGMFDFSSTSSSLPSPKVVQPSNSDSFSFGQSSFGNTQNQNDNFGGSFDFNSDSTCSIPSSIPKQRIPSTFSF